MFYGISSSLRVPSFGLDVVRNYADQLLLDLFLPMRGVRWCDVWHQLPSDALQLYTPSPRLSLHNTEWTKLPL